MSTPLPSAAPPWAVTIWADDNAVYVELPTSPGNPPYVTRYPFTEAGLSKALWIMRKAYTSATAGRTQPANYTTHPFLTSAPATNDAVRIAAREVMRKLGML